MSKIIAAAHTPTSGFMPLLGTASAFAALLVVGIVVSASAMVATMM